MGLTIHYQLATTGDEAPARQLVQQLRQAALDMPFEHVGARLEQEMDMLGRDFRAVEQSYADNVLNLTLIRGYTKKLLENGKVARFLKANYPDILGEFEVIVTAE